MIFPLPRFLDHMGAEDGPSDAEEEGKEVKRQRSASTTPRSTSGTLPHDCDMVMGIAPVEPQESERLEERIIQTFKTRKKRLHIAESRQKHMTSQPQRLLGLGSFMGDMAAHHYENVWNGCYPKKLSPLLPATLGEV